MSKPLPLPHDPRTPAQAAQDRLAAALLTLRTTNLPRGERRQLADRITQLRADIDRLTPA